MTVGRIKVTKELLVFIEYCRTTFKIKVNEFGRLYHTRLASVLNGTLKSIEYSTFSNLLVECKRNSDPLTFLELVMSTVIHLDIPKELKSKAVSLIELEETLDLVRDYYTYIGEADLTITQSGISTLYLKVGEVVL